MPFDIAAARKAGYSDSDISDFLAKQHSNFDVQGAMKAGYSVDEIATRLDKPKDGIVSKVMSKAADISPELVNPVNMIPGVAAAKIGNAALSAVDEGYNKMGDMAAEAIDQGGKHPYLSSAVGGTIKNIPAGVMAADALANVGGLAKGTTEVGKMIKGGAKAAVSKLQSMADTLMGPGEKASMLEAERMTQPAREGVASLKTALKGASNPTPELMKTQEAQAGLKDKFNVVKDALTGLKSKAGKKIGELETGAGLKFNELSDRAKEILSNPQVLGHRASSYGRIVEQGPEQLASKMDLQTLQDHKKFITAALKRNDLSDATRVNLSKAKPVFDRAIDTQVPGLKQQVDEFRIIDQQLKNLPKAQKAEADSLRLSIKRQQNTIRAGKIKTQGELQQAQMRLDDLNKQAETLIQKGQRRDIVRGRIKNAAIGTAVAAGAPTLLKKLMD